MKVTTKKGDVIELTEAMEKPQKLLHEMIGQIDLFQENNMKAIKEYMNSDEMKDSKHKKAINEACCAFDKACAGFKEVYAKMNGKKDK